MIVQIDTLEGDVGKGVSSFKEKDIEKYVKLLTKITFMEM